MCSLFNLHSTIIVRMLEKNVPTFSQGSKLQTSNIGPILCRGFFATWGPSLDSRGEPLRSLITRFRSTEDPILSSPEYFPKLKVNFINIELIISAKISSSS